MSELTGRERIAQDLEKEIGESRQREARLKAEVAAVTAEVKAFESALARLRNEPLINTKRGRPKGSSSPTPSGGKIGPEPLAEIASAIREYAIDHDEFRQVDIRNYMPGGMNSSKMATGFEQLRQDGLIRLSRRDGISKFFRLTETARAEQTDAR